MGRTWYNTAYHTALKCTPFKLVYGRDPPQLVAHEAGSTLNFEVEAAFQERDRMLETIKDNLVRAQVLMKNNADKHRRDLEFEVGSMVFLKLRPYRQHSVSRRLFQKLAARYYGPFEVLARVGKVAYKLKLPESSPIHPIFHVSQLKPVIGEATVVTELPPVLDGTDEVRIEPEEILDTRYDEEGYLEVLVKWSHLPTHETSWLRARDVRHQFPSFSLEDKLKLVNGGIDMMRRVYVRKRNMGEEEDKEEKEEEVELAVE